VQLIQLYLEELHVVMATHVGIVLADRGLDLRNMSSMDASKIKLQLGHKQWMHITPDLNTPSFHQYLRNYIEHLPDISAVFGMNSKMLYTSSEYNSVRRTCILDLVFRKRRQYVARLFAQRKLVLHIPQVTLSDVRSFIGGGADPVQSYLVAAYRKYDATLGQQMDYRAGLKIHEVDANGNKVVMMRSSCMNLLCAVTPEDMGLLYVTMAERLIEHRSVVMAKKANTRRQTAHGRALLLHKALVGASLSSMVEGRLTVGSDSDGLWEEDEEQVVPSPLRPASPPGRKGSGSLLENTRRMTPRKT
jgi:hypothetical protein